MKKCTSSYGESLRIRVQGHSSDFCGEGQPIIFTRSRCDVLLRL